jgi:AcrR family transcriptional regulator
MEYKEFKKQFGASSRDIAREVFVRNQASMQVKKEKTAINNLDKIFNAVFSITYKKGFQAMSMRDLSKKTGMSLGSLYAYFTGKEKLLGIIQAQGWSILKKNLNAVLKRHKDPKEKLFAAIRAHIYLSEIFRPWFYFMFMEARNIKPANFESVKSMEEYTQKILTDILEQGEEKKIFKPDDHILTASMIKSMQQEWYLKRWKYRALKVSVDQFADHLICIIAAFCIAEK